MLYTCVQGEPAVSYRWTGWVRDFKRITDRYRGIYRLYLKWMKAKPEDVNMWLAGSRITRILTDSIKVEGA